MKSARTSCTALVALVATAVGIPANATPDAKDILTKMTLGLKQTFTAGKSYQATITKVGKGPDSSSSATMRVKMIPGKKLRADITMTSKPLHGGKSATQIIRAADDGMQGTLYLVDKKTAVIQPSNIANSSALIASLCGLPMNLASSMRIVKATISGSTSVMGKPAYVIMMAPLKPGMGGLDATQFTIDKAAYRLRKMDVRSKTTPYTLTIRDEIIDKPIAQSVFKISIPAGVKVKDARHPAKPGGSAKH